MSQWYDELNKKVYIHTVLWLLAAGSTLLLAAKGVPYSAFVEAWYSRGVFQGVRWLADHTMGRLPIAGFYIFWAVVAGWWILQIKRRPRLLHRRSRMAFWLLNLVRFACLILVLFYWLWGFNYHRVPVAEQLGLQRMPLDTAILWKELRDETVFADALRKRITGSDTTALSDHAHWPLQAEDTIRAAVENWLQNNHYPVSGRVRGRFLRPPGILRVMGTAGIYWPFVGEGNVDSGMHPLEQLPDMAHEMAHGYGFGDEGICNFIAYAACRQHTHPYVAYAACLSYWRIVASNCLQSDPERYNSTFRPCMPTGMRRDLNSIYKQNARFREWMPRLRYQVYDHYLKTQGIASGMLNYDEVIVLVRALKEKEQ